MHENSVRSGELSEKVQIALSEDEGGVEVALRSRGALPRFIDCTHHKPATWTSLIHLSQTDDKAYRVLITLAKRGYIIYRAPALGTCLVHRLSLREVWKPLREHEYQQTADGTVYKFAESRHSGPPTSLVVVFSSVAKTRFTQHVERHVGAPLPSLERSVSGHTAVLRIADMDGVVGGYYLPTTRDPESANHIQRLIKNVASNLGIESEQIVTYGVSKGGTGAFYHGLRLNSHAVAVDPIVTLNRRNTRSTDPYFSSSSIYLESFDATFQKLTARQQGPAIENSEGKVKQVMITSANSKEFSDVMSLAQHSAKDTIKVIESLEPHIRQHNEVGSNTVPLSLSLINLLSQGVEFSIPAVSQAR